MKRWILAFLVSGTMSVSVQAVGEPQGQLKSSPSCVMSDDVSAAIHGFLQASSSVGYRGTMLVEYGGDREFIAVHADPESGQNALKRLNQSAGAAPRLVASSPRVSNGPCDLARHYGLVLEPGMAVAGRATYRLSARPRDTLRLAYVMDIDSEFHVPLRVLAASPDGKILERYEFAEIALEAKPAAPKPEPTTADIGDTKGDVPRYFLAAIPPGFKVVDQGRRPVDFLVLSDGLASVSIFIEEQPRSLPSGEGFALRGATLTYNRGIAKQRLVTVLGEVPITTARLLAEALRARGETQ